MSENGNILLEAHKLINGERQAQYGDPALCFDKISRFWSTYLGRAISPVDVACMMVLLKLARQSYEHKDDNFIDIAGYAGLAADIAKHK